MPCTYHIQISRETVAVKIYDADSLKAEVSGNFVRAHLPKIRELHEKVRTAKSGEAIDADELGRLLFESLFHDKLRSDFFLAYQNAKPDNPLRVELEADERKLSDIVSLPWEFLCKPADEDGGIIRFASDPKMIFSRWRAQGNLPQPIRLAAGEDLRIVLAVAAPSDLGKVRYEEVLNTIRKLAQTERIGLSEFVDSATRKTIDDALKNKKPDIFHFIGHGDMKDGGQIALVNDFGTAEWVKADKFGELFNRHTPGVVLLQSCESGALSASEAYTGIASRVIQQQIPAVIAMQYEVSNATACDFASEFYRCLSKGNPADLAAQEARRHIELQSSGNTRDFATPVLFMRVQKGKVFQREIPDLSEIDDLIKQAHKKEHESDYRQAIKTWRILEHIKIKNLEPDKQIKRLKDCIALEQIKSAISKQGSNLPFLNQINDYIEQVKKEGVSENEKDFINSLRNFASKKLSKDVFTKKCAAKFVSVSYQVQSDLPSYENMAKRLMRGEIIPVLGTEALRLSQIAQKMAMKIEYGSSAGTLSMISQYYQYKESRPDLLHEFKGLIEAEQKNFAGELNPIYNLLKKIKEPFIMISSSYDSLWECMFQNNGKKYAILSPINQNDSSSNNQERAKIVFKYHDKPQDEIEPDDISKFKLLENGYSIIYKICGGCGLDSGDDDTLMLSETDFFAVSKCLGDIIPSYLINRARKKSFLFLGYDLEQWHDRLIAHSILEKANKLRSFAVRKSPTPYQRAFWKSNHIDIYDVDLQDFINNLNQFIS